MATLRAFRADDLFRFNNINLDPLTGFSFYSMSLTFFIMSYNPLIFI